LLQVLSEDERAQVHECTLRVLTNTGLQVDTAWGRQILKDAGAEVDKNTNIVHFPRALIEESLRSAPKEFTLGARRPGWDLRMNGGDCTLLIDGEAMFVLDRETGERRPGTFNDWLEATRLIDALDEVGVYWHMVEASDSGDTMADSIMYWRNLFRNFSKHVQDPIISPEQAPWLLEVLQVIFGDKETIRCRHPLSFLLCPQSPLVIEGPYTDAYLALLGWDIPVAAMRRSSTPRLWRSWTHVPGGTVVVRSSRDCSVRRQPRWPAITACRWRLRASEQTTRSLASRRAMNGQ
jgi:trimethylamine--corrinoid protein Co-methyltransferase